MPSKGLWHRAVYAFIIDKKEMCYYRKEVQIKKCGQICGMLQLEDMSIVMSLEDKH